MIPEEVKRHLRGEPNIAPLIDRLEVPERPDFDGDVYFGLLRSITYQQLSGKAAGTIFGRFLQLFPDEYPYPDRLLEMDVPALRAVGLSRAKVAYIQNVATFWQANKLGSIDWADRSDEEIMELLISIKGIGQWTVEMVLIFILHRPDVLPLDDLVVRRNLVELFGLEELKGKQLKAAMRAAAEPWRPYRSYASRYLWALKNQG